METLSSVDPAMEVLRECALHVYLRLQAATLHVALLFFIVVQHDDTGIMVPGGKAASAAVLYSTDSGTVIHQCAASLSV